MPAPVIPDEVFNRVDSIVAFDLAKIERVIEPAWLNKISFQLAK